MRVNGRDAAANASARGPAFHYASERTLLLGQLTDYLPPTLACTLTPGARRTQVIAVKVTTASGASVHVRPFATGSALYLDHRDLSALEGGAIVPDLADVVERLR